MAKTGAIVRAIFKSLKAFVVVGDHLKESLLKRFFSGATSCAYPLTKCL